MKFSKVSKSVVQFGSFRSEDIPWILVWTEVTHVDPLGSPFYTGIIYSLKKIWCDTHTHYVTFIYCASHPCSNKTKQNCQIGECRNQSSIGRIKLIVHSGIKSFLTVTWEKKIVYLLLPFDYANSVQYCDPSEQMLNDCFHFDVCFCLVNLLSLN